MVSQIQGNSVNNVSFASNALRYLQNEPLSGETSLFDDVKSSAKFGTIFAALFQIPTFVKSAKMAKKTGKGFKNAFVDVTAAKTAKEAASAVKEPGKIAKALKLDKLGASLSKNVVNTGVGKALKLPKLAKFFKGAGLGSMIAFNAVFQLMEIIPAFKNNGVEAGVKQVGKSAVSATVDGVAYSVGLKLGSMAGAKIGAAIGTSIAPAIGTVIGAIGGMVLGGIASTIGAKICSKIFGKNQSEINAQNQHQEQAQQIAQDKEAMGQLQELVAQKIVTEQEQGKVSDATVQMANQLQDTLTSSQGQSAQAATSQNPVSQTTASQNPQTEEKLPEGTYRIKDLPRLSNGQIDPSIFKMAAPPVENPFAQMAQTQSNPFAQTKQQQQTFVNTSMPKAIYS
jgi:hypothetical protein